MTLSTELRIQLAMKVVLLVVALVINWQLWQMRRTLDEMIVLSGKMIAETEAAIGSLE